MTSSIPYRVEDTGYTTPCWLWQHNKTAADGYAQVWSGGSNAEGRMLSAHRIYYERVYGQIPEGLFIDHLCRVPHCVNPDHLEPVTNAENIHRGTGAKLNWEKVKEIRALYATGDYTHRELGKLFGVSHTNIRYVVIGRAWKDDG